jgi:hypothetical protein
VGSIGGGILQIANEMVRFSQNLFCIIPVGFIFNIQSGVSDPSVFYTCKFNGDKSKILE